MIFDWEFRLAKLTTQELYDKAMEFKAKHDALMHSQPMIFALMDELRPLWREYSHYFSTYEERLDRDTVIKCDPDQPPVQVQIKHRDAAIKHPAQISFDFSKESE